MPQVNRTSVMELEEALDRIRDLSKPGQELGIKEAVDILCEIWNIADYKLRN